MPKDKQKKAAKRSLEGEDAANKKMTAESRGESKEADTDDLVFEDPFEDELEDEEMVEDETEEGETEGEVQSESSMQDTDDAEEKPQKSVWRPGVDPIAEDEVLDYDESAYDLFFALKPEWPSLSIDIIRDNLGARRTKFPMTATMVVGSQADRAANNKITVMKLSELQRTKHTNDDSGDEGDESEDEGTEDDPILESRTVSHHGGVNRIRSMPQKPSIVATWSDTGKVHLWDIAPQLASLNGSTAGGPLSSNAPAVFTHSKHSTEGFAMDWSPVKEGSFATGDCSGKIHIWKHSGSSWTVDSSPYTGHKESVEDLQWSPTEETVFASCSADQTVRIWDTRRHNGSMLDIKAHDADVNVISWNRIVSRLIVSGSDDGTFKIWDLRKFKSDSPVAHFKYHTQPITSVEWHPNDESIIAVASADNQLTIWDMSLEEDAESSAAAAAAGTADFPPQLLFIHQGQNNVKELHFHPQLPGVIVSTAADGYNIFRPSNI